MSKINIRSFSNENDDGAPDIVGVSTFSSTAYFVPTKGNTTQRPSDHVEVGSIRFNTDTSNLEFYRGHGIGWSQFELIDPELGGGTGSNTGLGTRAVLPGGNGAPSRSASMSFLTISTLGNTQDFGDLSAANNANAGASSRTRGLSFGGSLASPVGRVNTIEFFTFASLGDAANFGDMTIVRAELGSTSNNVRGIAAGGSPGPKDELDYIAIAQTGNAVDFGDLAVAREGVAQGCISNGTRGIFTGGNAPTMLNNIEFVTIMSTGNTSDFGDMTATMSRQANCCSSTRGLISGGMNPSVTNTIEFITIATTGNSADFGDMTSARYNHGAASSPTRGVFVGGQPGPNAVNVIDYVEIATLGNAVDFGDTDVVGMTNGIIRPTGTSSNGHGGL